MVRWWVLLGLPPNGDSRSSAQMLFLNGTRVDVTSPLHLAASPPLRVTLLRTLGENVPLVTLVPMNTRLLHLVAKLVWNGELSTVWS